MYLKTVQLPSNQVLSHRVHLIKGWGTSRNIFQGSPRPGLTCQAPSDQTTIQHIEAETKCTFRRRHFQMHFLEISPKFVTKWQLATSQHWIWRVLAQGRWPTITQTDDNLNHIRIYVSSGFIEIVSMRTLHVDTSSGKLDLRQTSLAYIIAHNKYGNFTQQNSWTADNYLGMLLLLVSGIS